jgi:hypothetical protein
METITREAALPYSLKCGVVVGWSHVSPGLDMAKLTVHPDKIVLEVNWILKIRKYELTKPELLEIEVTSSVFGYCQVRFRHNSKTNPPFIAITMWCKDSETLKAALLKAAYEFQSDTG